MGREHRREMPVMPVTAGGQEAVPIPRKPASPLPSDHHMPPHLLHPPTPQCPAPLPRFPTCTPILLLASLPLHSSRRSSPTSSLLPLDHPVLSRFFLPFCSSLPLPSILLFSFPPSGADFIECCDVVLTKDYVPICRHEPLLSNTTNADSVFPTKKRTYVIDGYNSTGVHAIDLTLKEVRTGMRRLACRWPPRGPGGGDGRVATQSSGERTTTPPCLTHPVTHGALPSPTQRQPSPAHRGPRPLLLTTTPTTPPQTQIRKLRLRERLYSRSQVYNDWYPVITFEECIHFAQVRVCGGGGRVCWGGGMCVCVCVCPERVLGRHMGVCLCVSAVSVRRVGVEERKERRHKDAGRSRHAGRR